MIEGFYIPNNSEIHNAIILPFAVDFDSVVTVADFASSNTQPEKRKLDELQDFALSFPYLTQTAKM